MKHSFLAVLLAVAVIAPLVVTTTSAEPARAAVAARFEPGNLISDATMYDGSAMSSQAVQEFLSARVPDCQGTCLVNLREKTPDMAAGRCASYVGMVSERASDMIAKVGAACGISQKSILVLIEKESSLVSASNPSTSRFRYATGYGCPDTAPCDPAYSGFFYQVYYAARQLVTYSQTASQWNYQAGRTNQIRYHPKVSCGSAPVFIQNKATAGLYIYTPYQPNTAALENIYGVGDDCSSYGNRNFWRIFTDWFGSPTAASSLMRTADSGTVFLVTESGKYPVPSLGILSALSPLGKVGFVSQKFLDSIPTAHAVGRSIRGPDGSIYFFDAGIRLPFSSCAQAVDYGASCNSDGYVQLSEFQIDAFAGGPVLGPVLGTIEGGRYYIKNGTKSEILDDQSQQKAGLPLAMNVLTENAIAALPYAPPIVRDGVYIHTRGSAQYSLLAEGERHDMTQSTVDRSAADARASGSLSPSSMRLLPRSPVLFEGILKSIGKAAPSVLTENGRIDLIAGGLQSGVSVVSVPQTLVDSYPISQTLSIGSFVKTPQSATVYIVMAQDIRPIGSWGALLALTPAGKPSIENVPDYLIGLLSSGPVALTAGTLVRSPESATVYLINGLTNRIALSSFDFPVAAGFSRLVFASDERIRAYPLSDQLMGFGFQCADKKFIAGGGQVHFLDPAIADLYPFQFLPLDRYSCGQLAMGSPATDFIRTPDGSIYRLSEVGKNPVASMARYEEISGGRGWTEVPASFANAFITGSPA